MAPVKKAGGGEAAPSLSVVLAGLSPRRDKLDELDKQLVAAVTLIEEKLRAHVSTRIHTVIDTSEAPGDEMWCERLAFGKIDGRWQLLIETGETDSPSSWKMQTLASAPREMRVRVFTEGFVEQLVRDAAKQLDSQIAERAQAMTIAADVLNALEAADDIPF